MQLGNHWIYYKILEVMLMRVSTWNRLLKARHSRDLNKKCEFCWCTKRNSNLNQIRRVRECNWNQWFGPDRNHLPDPQCMSNFRDNPRDNPVEIEIDNITDGKDIHGFDNDKYQKSSLMQSSSNGKLLSEKPYLITTTLCVTFIFRQIAWTRCNFVIEWQWVLDNPFKDFGVGQNQVEEDQVDPEMHSASNQKWSWRLKVALSGPKSKVAKKCTIWPNFTNLSILCVWLQIEPKNLWKTKT